MEKYYIKVFIIIFIVFSFFGCIKEEDPSGGNVYYVESYRLINPNNLFYNCQGNLTLNYTRNNYSLIYDITCIYKKDTVDFYFSDTGEFSDFYDKVTYETPFGDEGYYFSGKLSFSPDLNPSWGCTYQLSDSLGFVFTFLNPTPHLITNIPVYDQKIVVHTMDSVQIGLINPWIEVVPIESGLCDSMQLFWM